MKKNKNLPDVTDLETRLELAGWISCGCSEEEGIDDGLDRGDGENY
jgi:hypothetical protein